MRVLYVCGTYIPASGGSEKSSHALLRELIKRGHKVLVITGFGPDAKKRKVVIDCVRIQRIANNELEYALNEAKRNLRPDVVLTQLIWSDKVLAWAKCQKLPTAYFVRSIGGKLKLKEGHPFSPKIIFSNSRNTALFVQREWHRNSVVVYPIVDFKDYMVKKRKPVYIVMFNPVEVKGGEIFKGIATKMPKHKFLAIEGWHQLKKKSLGEWDIEKMKLMADAYGESKVLLPKEVDFSNVRNVKYIGAIKDVRKIYRKTKILLLPSLWEEASARVIREAMVNGIPVIASNNGGIRETIGSGGIIIDNYLNINAWIREIKKFDDDKYYIHYSIRARNEALKFDYKGEVDKVEIALKRISQHK